MIAVGRGIGGELRIEARLRDRERDAQRLGRVCRMRRRGRRAERSGIVATAVREREPPIRPVLAPRSSPRCRPIGRSARILRASGKDAIPPAGTAALTGTGRPHDTRHARPGRAHGRNGEDEAAMEMKRLTGGNLRAAGYDDRAPRCSSSSSPPARSNTPASPPDTSRRMLVGVVAVELLPRQHRGGISRRSACADAPAAAPCDRGRARRRGATHDVARYWIVELAPGGAAFFASVSSSTPFSNLRRARRPRRARPAA